MGIELIKKNGNVDLTAPKITGAVKSVNGKKGDVVLTADDVGAVNNKYDGFLFNGWLLGINSDGDVKPVLKEFAPTLDSDVLNGYATEEYVDNSIANIDISASLLVTVDVSTMTANYSKTEIINASTSGKVVYADVMNQLFILKNVANASFTEVSYLAGTKIDLTSFYIDDEKKVHLNVADTFNLLPNYSTSDYGKYVTPSANGLVYRELPDVDLTGYATEKYVDDAIAAIDIPSGGSGGAVTENGWTKLGDITISNTYEYEMLSAENGVITIDTGAANYDYLATGNRRFVLQPINLTTKESAIVGQTRVNDATAGTFNVHNRDGVAQTNASYDVAKYKLVADNVGKIVMENISDYDNYKLRVTTPIISTHGLRTFFASNMSALSFPAVSTTCQTGGAIIEIQILKFPYDENYFYKNIRVSYGKSYAGNSSSEMQSTELCAAGRGINKPSVNGEVSFEMSNMIFVNGTRFELWGMNDA